MELVAVGELRPHPEADRVPALTGGDYRLLRADIARRGVLVPLAATPSGFVLDGCARLAIAGELGLEAVPVRESSPSVKRSTSFLRRSATGIFPPGNRRQSL